MCLPAVEILTFAISSFVPIYHPSVYQFHTKNTQLCLNWVLFIIICLECTQFMSIWCLYLRWKPFESLYQNLWKSTPKGRHIYVYHVNVRSVRTPSGSLVTKILPNFGCLWLQSSFFQGSKTKARRTFCSCCFINATQITCKTQTYCNPPDRKVVRRQSKEWY